MNRNILENHLSELCEFWKLPILSLESQHQRPLFRDLLEDEKADGVLSVGGVAYFAESTLNPRNSNVKEVRDLSTNADEFICVGLEHLKGENYMFKQMREKEMVLMKVCRVSANEWKPIERRVHAI